MTKRVLFPKHIRHKIYKATLIHFKQVNDCQHKEDRVGLCYSLAVAINNSKLLGRRVVYKDLDLLPEFQSHKPKQVKDIHDYWFPVSVRPYDTNTRIRVLEDCIEKSKPKRNVNKV